MHLPPALPAERRRAVIGDASAFVRTAGASVKIVAGDLNKAQCPRGGGWLFKALGPKGPLAGFRAPYRPGDPTNVVWQVGRPSERELDWVLMGPKTPCVWANKVLLAGLSTHRMVQCNLAFAERVFTAADPSCRRFRWSQLRPEHQAPAAAAASLALWWSAHARLTPAGTVQAVWAALEGLVPSQKNSLRPPDRDVLRAAQELDAGAGSATAHTVQAWWQERQDAAYGALMRVEKAKLDGLALTSQTGWAVRLRPPKFRLLNEASPDGVRFPDTLEAFQEELLRQAQELHCGHACLALDLSRLQAPVRPGDSTDDPDFISRMRAALPRPPEPLVTGAPPTYHHMEQAVKKGSPATSLNELPRPLVSALPRFGLRVLVSVVEALASGTPSRLLSAVLHVCLAKKLPPWLVRNSRPVMLEPYLRRLETGVVQDRRVTRREPRRAVPLEHFAYRRQLLGQSLALACRWLLAGWAIQHGEVCRTIGMRRMPSAIPTARWQGRVITRPLRSLCRPGFRASTMGSTCG